jgi:ectoine hydroxylase-related dioxygenase (phytanoyl-CoA dioxygenase family)
MAAVISLLADVAAFHADGYWHQRAVLAPDAVRGLRDELDRLLVVGGRLPWTGPWLTAEAGLGYLPIRDLVNRSPAWHDVCHGVLRSTAGELLGTPAFLDEAVGIIKPAKIGQTFPLHQDGIYYAPENGRLVIANVYLDDVTPDNGSLRLAPGSHTRGLLPHTCAFGKKALAEADVPPTLVEPQAAAGDVVWFDLWTVHGSAPNRSRSLRRAVRAGYVGGPQ